MEREARYRKRRTEREMIKVNGNKCLMSKNYVTILLCRDSETESDSYTPDEPHL